MTVIIFILAVCECYLHCLFNKRDLVPSILSFTSPRDVCRFSSTSKLFNSAAESGIVWQKFIAIQYFSTTCSLSKKQLYFDLCDNPILFDHGKKGISIEKGSGKVCYFISARDLYIVWGDDPLHWTWTSHPATRFPEVAELISVCWLEIHAKINTYMLSQPTLYKFYLVFKTTMLSGFKYQPLEVSVGLVGTQARKKTVYLDTEKASQRPRLSITRRSRLGWYNNRRSTTVRVEQQYVEERETCYPEEREDGWLELELGHFFNYGKAGELEMSVLEVNGGNWKCGLIVHGIEIRPN